MEAVKEKKKAWRRLLLDLFALVPREDRRRLDLVLAEKLDAFVRESGAGMVLAYAPMSDEPDLTIFLRRWLAGGGGLALPVWMGGQNMVFRRVDDLDSQLKPGRAGIMIPQETLPEVKPEELDLVITPGRVFSEARDRLGRGSGCYDVLFSRYDVTKVGVAYDFQIFPKVPVEPADVPLDAVITPSRLLVKESG